jgi:hypothetical protein
MIRGGAGSIELPGTGQVVDGAPVTDTPVDGPTLDMEGRDSESTGTTVMGP